MRWGRVGFGSSQGFACTRSAETSTPGPAGVAGPVGEPREPILSKHDAGVFCLFYLVFHLFYGGRRQPP